MSIVCTLILQQFFVQYPIILKPFIRYPPSIVRRKYFSIIFFEKSVYYTL